MKKKIKQWIKRIGLGLLALIFLCIIVGIIYEQVGRVQANKSIKHLKGSFIDVGGHKLYFESLKKVSSKGSKNYMLP